MTSKPAEQTDFTYRVRLTQIGQMESIAAPLVTGGDFHPMHVHERLICVNLGVWSPELRLVLK